MVVLGTVGGEYISGLASCIGIGILKDNLYVKSFKYQFIEQDQLLVIPYDDT